MKSRFIRAVSAPNSWEDHHHLILSLRPVMGIQRAGYQTVQSAGKTCAQTRAHTNTRGGEKEKTRLWHIWSLPPQLRVNYRCWREAKSRSERNRKRRERTSERQILFMTPPHLPKLRIPIIIYFFPHHMCTLSPSTMEIEEKTNPRH